MRAELYAIVKALGIIDPTCKAKVIVYTDAYSLVQMVTSGELEKWKNLGGRLNVMRMLIYGRSITN